MTEMKLDKIIVSGPGDLLDPDGVYCQGMYRKEHLVKLTGPDGKVYCEFKVIVS